MARTKMGNIKKGPHPGVKILMTPQYIPYNTEASKEHRFHNTTLCIVEDHTKKAYKNRIVSIIHSLPEFQPTWFCVITTPSSQGDSVIADPWKTNGTRTHTRNYTETTVPTKYKGVVDILLQAHHEHKWPPPHFTRIR